MAAKLSADLVLLDLGSSRKDGLALVRELRGWSQVPIIVLGTRAKEGDEVQALDGGADDYLPASIGSDELLARMRVAFRHASMTAEGVEEPLVEIGPIKVDFTNRQISIDETEVHLTPNEFSLLAILVKHAGRVVTHLQLLREAWGGKPSTHYLRVYMASLRKKLESNPDRPRIIITDPGVGYRLSIRPPDLCKSLIRPI
jgi:two-component system KDP operon response regulator KdpE